MKLILLCIVLASCTARGESVIGGHYSHHLKEGDITNSHHGLLAYQNEHFIGARFKNSYGVTSYLAGYFKEVNYGNLSLYGAIGGVYGYTKCFGHDDSGKNLCPILTGGLGYKFLTTSSGTTLSANVIMFGNALIPSVRVQW